MRRISPEPERFFDADDVARGPARIVVERFSDEHELWKMERRIGYSDRHCGDLVVPADLDTWLTDFTSVPHLFTWLVPRTGSHLPAALVHDGLITDGDREHLGAPVTPVEADRVFRDAMCDAGTPFVRRWMVWAAVSTRSVAKMGRPALAAVLFATFAAVAVLGYIAALDLFDQVHLVPWMKEGWPLMGDEVWWRELRNGAIAAVLVPFALALPWALARLYLAGLIVAWALAVLLPVTLVVAAITGTYLLIEYRLKVFPRLSPGRALTLLVAALAAVGGIVALTIWLCVRR